MALDPSYTPDPEDETKPADIGVAFGYAFKELRFLKAYLKDKFTNIFDPHVAATDNPHAVTKEQVGLPNIPDWDSSVDPALGDSDTTLVSQKAIRDAINLALSVKIFGIGAYYITEDNANPNTILGFGTWELLEAGRGIVSREPTNNLSEYYNAGTEGGSDSKSISANNLPAHTHPINDPGHKHKSILHRNSISGVDLGNSSYKGMATSTTGQDYDTSTSGTGISVLANSTTHQNLDVRNRYRVTNIWRRVA